MDIMAKGIGTKGIKGTVKETKRIKIRIECN
jgi:hypothetical protein